MLFHCIYFIQQNYRTINRRPMNRHQHTYTGPQYFGTAKKKSCFQTFDSSIPGPGAHSPFTKPSIPAPEWKIGNEANRNTFLDPHLKSNPSPQQYKINHTAIQKVSKQMSIPLSTYKPKNDINDGCYNPNTEVIKNGCPQFSFGYFQESDYSTLAPGPGTYQTLREKISHNKGQNGFSSSLRPPPYGQSGKFPGPGKYFSKAFGPSSKYSFGRASREMHKSHDPPARFYDLSLRPKPIRMATCESQCKREPSFIPKNDVPGPNAYRNELPSKIPSGLMETSNRIPIENMAIISYPSSDKYSQHKQYNKKKAQSFTKESRKLSPRAKIVPGPGTYEPMPTLSKIGGAMPKKKQSNEDQQLPGAASYDPKQLAIRKKAASSVILRSQRTDFSKTITKDIGPGEYNIANQSQAELGKIGKSSRQYSPNKNPGVGEYNLPNFIGKLPNYCNSNKKVTEDGFSTFHQKLKMKIMQKQDMMRSLQLRKKKTEQISIIEANPEH